MRTTKGVSASSKPTSRSLVARIIARGNKDFGEHTFTTLAGARSEIRSWFTTGIPPLDVILSGSVGRGFPSGRMVELYGDEHVGKTTVGCRTLAAAQESNGFAVMFDTEGTFTENRASHLGIDIESLIYGQEEYLEPILEEIVFILDQLKDSPAVIFWDTIAGTPTLSERTIKAGQGKGQAGHARALSTGLRTLNQKLVASNAVLLACNQLKVGDIGKLFATEREREATLGGKAMRFHCHMRLRLEFTRKFFFTVGDQRTLIGDEITAMVTKDKDGPSNVRGRNAILVFRKVGEGGGRFSLGLSSLRTLQEWGVSPKGNTITFSGKKYTPTTFDLAYNTKPEFRTAIHKALEVCRERLLRDASVGDQESVEEALEEEEEL